MNFKKNIILLILLCFFNIAFSQISQEKYIEAKILRENNYLRKSLNVFLEILENDKENANINYEIGKIYSELGQLDSSIYYLLKAEKNISPDYVDNYNTIVAPFETWFILGKCFQMNLMFDEAIERYDTVLYYSNDKYTFDLVNHKIEECNVGIELLSMPIDITIMPLNSIINTSFKEHSPVVTADLQTLIFTSNRDFVHETEEDWDENIYISYMQNGLWTKPISISSNINTRQHEASVGVSVDGKILYIYKETLNGDIYQSNKINNEWSVPERLSINSIYRETHACISENGNRLYFSSNRPNGQGGMDIYYCDKLENGKWGEPINIGTTVNTPFDEEGPFISPNDSSLIFSSNGHESMGGYDLFSTQLLPDKTWTKPKNLGFPINTPGDDLYYVSSAGGNFAFYVSNKYGIYEDTDIFLMMLPETEKNPIGVYNGKVEINPSLENISDTVSFKISIIDPSTNEIIKTYYTDPYTKDFSIILPIKKKYIATFESNGFITHVEEIYIDENTDLHIFKDLVTVQKVVENETNETLIISFEPETNILTPESEIFLSQTSKTLIEYPELFVEINVPDSDNLYIERTNSIFEYLISENTDTSKITFNFSEEQNYELLIADSLFLLAYQQDWDINFDPNSSLINTFQGINLNKLNMFLLRNPELFIEIPFSEDETSELEYERVKSLYNFFVTHGIDPARIITQNSNDESDSINSIQLSIQNNSSEFESLMDVLQRYEAKNYNLHLLSVDVVINNVDNFSVLLSNEIKSYFFERGLDSARVNFKLNNYNSEDENQLRLKISTNNQLANRTDILQNMFVFIPFYEADNYTKYQARQPIEINNPTIENEFYNPVRNNITRQNIQQTNRNSVADSITQSVQKRDCFYLYENIGRTFFMVYFEYAEYTTQNTIGLDSIANCLISNPEVVVEIGGHTDSKGNNVYNNDLSKKRSNFVLEYLINKGVNDNQLQIESYGETHPIAPNTSNGEDFPYGRQINRRVELRVLKTD